ncbi:glycosyltransferase [Acanthopleuribacter pedis]|uniref:Glycosyltransferase family 4 protein n=1 Tax=Acanthopleuribacter pedis TaxID=442870 RepID=A0A8J7U3G3_9BACT|nr:glycosyltransferase [Acanthopleuribacter pedis]MBO1317226.1 glycosyltransferase family 4 protein [Acanthopleuribacter pedis]MBO1318532.1 glycosyltransferase family 4 protein [Acanthopleuribacter pedis]
MQYLLVVPVAFYRAPDGRVACESAFVEHLRMTRTMFEPKFTSMRIAAPTMSDEEYEKNKHHLGHFTEEEEQIFYTRLHQFEASRLLFALFLWLPTYLKIIGAVRKASLVHSGLSFDILMPFEIFSLFAGTVMGKKTVFVIDIDNRKSADMRYATGAMSKKSYLISKYVYNPLRILQIRWAVRFCSLLMLKSQSLVDDYGKGKDHVKNFYDVAFSPEYVIPEDRLAQKTRDVQDTGKPLDLTFFGRLVPYKGIDYCIRAVKKARALGAVGARLHILGSGYQEDELKALTAELGAEDYVIFHGAVPFGPVFFNQLYDYHLLMAAPLSQDTPRSLFDAMAAGIPLLAFDTDYYKDLVNTGAVDVVPWRSVDALAEKIVAFHQDRPLLAQRIEAGVTFAKENSQDIWMARRHRWILDLFPD